MNKHLFPMILLALLSVTGLQARSYEFLNHLSVGVTGGTDAVGFQAAVPLGKHIVFRGAYVSGCGIAYDRTFRVDLDATWDNSDFSIHDDVNMRASLATKDIRGIFDLYPSKRGGFHFSLGVYYGLGSNRFIEVGNTTPLPIDPSEYHAAGISINGQFVTTDEEGFITGGIHVPKIRPYVGIGFGRPLRSDSRVTMTFDLGACYWERPTLQLTDYFGQPVIVTSESVQNMDEGWIDKVEGYAKFYPVINLGLHIRLF